MRGEIEMNPFDLNMLVWVGAKLERRVGGTLGSGWERQVPH